MKPLSDCQLYTDFRAMLKKKDLDDVIIATPDHWHALPMIEACKAGTDIYCQKPAGVDVVECQAMLAAARKYRRAVKLRPDRDDDFSITGKRHDFVVDYEVGYDDEGRIQAVAATYAARSGYSAELSGPVPDRDAAETSE